MKSLCAIIGAALCATLYGGSLPADVQTHIDAVQQAAKSNDFASAKAAYDKIDWRKVENPAATLADISKGLKSNKQAEVLRKEIKTKYLLLKTDTDADLTDNIETIPIIIEQYAVPVADKIEDKTFALLMDCWGHRYSKQIDYWDDKGNKIVPMPGSVLGLERPAVIRAVEAGGDYDALWDAYNTRLQQAVGRRMNLKKKR